MKQIFTTNSTLSAHLSREPVKTSSPTGIITTTFSLLKQQQRDSKEKIEFLQPRAEQAKQVLNSDLIATNY